MSHVSNPHGDAAVKRGGTPGGRAIVPEAGCSPASSGRWVPRHGGSVVWRSRCRCMARVCTVKNHDAVVVLVAPIHQEHPAPQPEDHSMVSPPMLGAAPQVEEGCQRTQDPAHALPRVSRLAVGRDQPLEVVHGASGQLDAPSLQRVEWDRVPRLCGPARVVHLHQGAAPPRHREVSTWYHCEHGFHVANRRGTRKGT